MSSMEKALALAALAKAGQGGGGGDGKSAFIRYSSNADGSGMTETWSAGQNYIGFMTGEEASPDNSDYTWSLFKGDSGNPSGNILQTTGTSTTDTMSQKAITDETNSIKADLSELHEVVQDIAQQSDLTDNESMKYVLFSKNDDFSIIDGYAAVNPDFLYNDIGFFSAPRDLGTNLYGVRFEVDRLHLKKFDVGNTMFSADFPVEVIPDAFQTSAKMYDFFADKESGFYLAHSGTDYYLAFPKSLYSGYSNFGTFIKDYFDGRIGLKLKSGYTEHDPSTYLQSITQPVYTKTDVVIDGVTYFCGFITVDITNQMSYITDYTTYTNAFGPWYGTLGNQYADSEYIYRQGIDRIWYLLRADRVGTHDLSHVIDYLVNQKHLKFYSISEEE